MSIFIRNQNILVDIETILKECSFYGMLAHQKDNHPEGSKCRVGNAK
jgi:hypothetical protein